MGVGFVDLSKLLLSSWVRIILGMVLQSEFPISLLNFVKAGILGDSKNLVIGALAVGVLLVEEFSLAFVNETIVIEEFLECSMGILGTVLTSKTIVVISACWVRQHEIRLADLVELALGVNSIARMFFRMPFSS
jgi:hypothetical protein